MVACGDDFTIAASGRLNDAKRMSHQTNICHSAENRVWGFGNGAKVRGEMTHDYLTPILLDTIPPPIRKVSVKREARNIPHTDQVYFGHRWYAAGAILCY